MAGVRCSERDEGNPAVLKGIQSVELGMSASLQGRSVKG